MTEILQNVQVFAPRRRRRRQSYDNTSLFSSKTAELKIDFWPSWISNRNDFTYFLSTIVTHMLPIKFQVNWPFFSEEAKNRFSRWQPQLLSWISDQNDFNYFLSPSRPPTKFQVSCPFCSGEETKNRFQDSDHGGHLGFLIGKILAIFDLQVTLMLPTRFKSDGSLVQEKKRKIDDQDGSHGSHAGFLIRTIFSHF